MKKHVTHVQAVFFAALGAAREQVGYFFFANHRSDSRIDHKWEGDWSKITRQWVFANTLLMLLMVQKSHSQPPFGCFWKLVIHGINYQPQLVSHQQCFIYSWWFQMFLIFTSKFGEMIQFDVFCKNNFSNFVDYIVLTSAYPPQQNLPQDAGWRKK